MEYSDLKSTYLFAGNTAGYGGILGRSSTMLESWPARKRGLIAGNHGRLGRHTRLDRYLCLQGICRSFVGYSHSALSFYVVRFAGRAHMRAFNIYDTSKLSFF